MTDVATKHGIKIDYHKSMKELKIPIFPAVARTGKGTKYLLDEIKYLGEGYQPHSKINYGEKIEETIKNMRQVIMTGTSHDKYRAGFITIQFLLNDMRIANESNSEVVSKLPSLRDQVAEQVGAVSVRRETECICNHYIETLLQDAVAYPDEDEQYFSSRIDKISAHKYIGMPIFLVIMWLILQTTFTWVGTPLSDQLDAFIGGTFTNSVKTIMSYPGVAPFLQDSITDDIIISVRSVLVFVPQIVALFFFISLLEDLGYMARIVALMDRIMRSLGLSGKSFTLVVIGSGCNVLNIMAMHSIENEKERLTTISIAPFMSYSARPPVYALFVSIFSKENQSLVVLSLHVLGTIMAFLVSVVLTKAILRNDNAIFIVELPTYRMPPIETLWHSAWEKAKGFARRAGTLIFGGSVVIWLLSYIGPHGINASINQSFLHIVGSFSGMLMQPLGFGAWQASATLVPGFLAKEVIVSSMTIIYSSGDAGLVDVIQNRFTPLFAYVFMIFILLYIPCVPTVAAVRKETYSWEWTALVVVYSLITVYVLMSIFYQVGHLSV